MGIVRNCDMRRYEHKSKEFPQYEPLNDDEVRLMKKGDFDGAEDMVLARRRLEASYPMAPVSQGRTYTMPSIADLPNAPSSHPLDRLGEYLLKEWGDHPAWMIDDTCPNGKGAAEIAIAILRDVKLELSTMDRSCPVDEAQSRKLEAINDPNGGR